MRETAPGAPAERRRVYSSPVATIAFDDVGPAPETVRLAVETSAEGYAATLDVPWAELGLASPPAPGTGTAWIYAPRYTFTCDASTESPGSPNMSLCSAFTAISFSTPRQPAWTTVKRPEGATMTIGTQSA